MRTILLAASLCVLTINGARAEKPSPPGLAKVMAEGSGRVANMTCADVRAVVGLYGERKAESVARAAGATAEQIAVARQCLTKK